jgi:acyl-CoA synthetase (AMP-forming)/AMP-acid ligase II
LGIIAAGGVFTGTNPSYTSFELKHHVKASKAKMIISEPEILDTIRIASSELNIPKSNLLILDDFGTEGFSSWKLLLDHGEQDWLRFDDLETSKNTTAMLLFSRCVFFNPPIILKPACPTILGHIRILTQFNHY